MSEWWWKREVEEVGVVSSGSKAMLLVDVSSVVLLEGCELQPSHSIASQELATAVDVDAAVVVVVIVVSSADSPDDSKLEFRSAIGLACVLF